MLASECNSRQAATGFLQSTNSKYYLACKRHRPALIYALLLIILTCADSGAAPSQPQAAVEALPVAAELGPRSERQPILDMFNKFFTKARSHDDQPQKEFVREGVIRRLRDLGFESSFLQKSRFELKHMPAASYNIISIIPGKHRHTKREKIVLVGAHWDTAAKAPVS